MNTPQMNFPIFVKKWYYLLSNAPYAPQQNWVEERKKK